MCLKTHLCGCQDESLSLILWISLKNMITRSNTTQMLYVKRQKEKIYILSYGGIFPVKTILVQRLIDHTAQKIIGQSTYFNSVLPHFKKSKYNRILIAFSVTIFA